ncbi:signal peptidase I [Sphingobacterium pedocola]|uniref:Signal peptidase I n=1 Tax=Sphingobacterium pedocola TaxID=2082722 RepID=A0ABR9TAI2_9SPHI|nr:signal peptidase I [Sphingobacterium pedocola]MBE8722339.1 signal peptidase I [Sphingobacterium pedocola]
MLTTDKRIKKKNSGWKGIAVIGMITILIVIALRIFLFASFKIPSLSMEPTLLAGDFILVNKLIPGPRIDFLGNKETNSIFRVPGLRAIQRKDVLVFNDPYYQSKVIVRNWNAHYVKRCIGLPGDTLSIKNGNCFISNDSTTAVVRKYQDENRLAIASTQYDTPRMFKSLGWTVHNFGSIYIPRKGDRITLDSVNRHIYARLIEYETDKKMTEMDGLFYLDTDLCSAYTFQKNYYFMAGDNSSDSKDSRYWGLLPEDHIVGKVSYVWKSIDPNSNKYRFDRFFKSLDE